jgi:hypothetical protein
VDGPFSKIERATASRVRMSSLSTGAVAIFTTVLCLKSMILTTRGAQAKWPHPNARPI